MPPGCPIPDQTMQKLTNGHKKIEEIMGQMECPKNFECVMNGFQQLCKARDFGVEGFAYCLEENPPLCSFALPFGFAFICRCTLRVHIAKNIGI